MKNNLGTFQTAPDGAVTHVQGSPLTFPVRRTTVTYGGILAPLTASERRALGALVRDGAQLANATWGPGQVAALFELNTLAGAV